MYFISQKNWRKRKRYKSSVRSRFSVHNKRKLFSTLIKINAIFLFFFLHLKLNSRSLHRNFQHFFTVSFRYLHINLFFWVPWISIFISKKKYFNDPKTIKKRDDRKMIMHLSQLINDEFKINYILGL